MRRTGFATAVVMAVMVAATALADVSVAPPSGTSGGTAALDNVVVGMSEGQVQALLGPPSAEGPYVRPLLSLDTLLLRGRGWRTYYYRGAGRVTFEGGSQLLQVGTVVRVDPDPNEPGRAR